MIRLFLIDFEPLESPIEDGKIKLISLFGDGKEKSISSEASKHRNDPCPEKRLSGQFSDIFLSDPKKVSRRQRNLGQDSLFFGGSISNESRTASAVVSTPPGME